MNRVLSTVLAGLIATATAFSPLEKAEAHHHRRPHRHGHYGRVYYHPVKYYRRVHRPRRYNHYYYRHGRYYRSNYYQNHRYRIRRHH
ncbi:MAG TPA: hypothetical protein VK203_00780 [Nostocaceae cyanobacterium]|nr:hypothetical protein [Nostocaceae cyanobacterium]